MFELITGEARHAPRDQRTPMLVSTAAHALLVTLVIVIPLLIATNQLPAVPTVMAFVAAAPPPPPPPLPPPPRPVGAPPPPMDRSAAPLESPRTVEPERREVEEDTSSVLEGTVSGGIAVDVVGVPAVVAPPPPPPPPPPAPHTPVRISGEIKAPALIKRVEPIYSQLAIAARVQGYVILEATVNEEGDVRDVKLLRSAHRFLDDEAILAVRQWRYSPLVISGQRVPFVLTVTLTFVLGNAAS